MVERMPPAGWYPNPEGSGQRYWDGRQWTDHYAHPPPAGDIYKLAAGKQIELRVNVYAADDVEAQLLGRKLDEWVERTVQVLMYRDYASPYKDAVRVDLAQGGQVGWVVKDHAPLACRVLDSLAKARKRNRRNLPLAAKVSMRVEGENTKDEYGVYRDVDAAVIRVKDPVTAEPLR